MAAIKVTHPETGATASVTAARFEILRERGWRLVDADDEPATPATPTDITGGEPSHRQQILAEVAGDSEKALVAYGAETIRDEDADPELLADLEQIINNANAASTTTDTAGTAGNDERTD